MGTDKRELIIDRLIRALEKLRQTKDVQAEIAYLREVR